MPYFPGWVDWNRRDPSAERNSWRSGFGRQKTGYSTTRGSRWGLQHASLQQLAWHHWTGTRSHQSHPWRNLGSACFSCNEMMLVFPPPMQVASRSLVCSGPLEIPERDPTAESAMEDVRTAVLGLLEILQVQTCRILLTWIMSSCQRRKELHRALNTGQKVTYFIMSYTMAASWENSENVLWPYFFFTLITSQEVTEKRISHESCLVFIEQMHESLSILAEQTLQPSSHPR